MEPPRGRSRGRSTIRRRPRPRPWHSPGDQSRLLGGRADRLATDQARGIGPRPVVPRALPASATVRCSFDRHALDGAAVRAALLGLVVRPGVWLRRRGQAARALSRTLKCADGTSWERTRRRPGPSAHDGDLRQPAYRLMDAAGLQRGRLTGIALRRGEGLVDAARAAHQSSLDGTREDRLPAEHAMDRIRDGSARMRSDRRPSSVGPPDWQPASTARRPDGGGRSGPVRRAAPRAAVVRRFRPSAGAARTPPSTEGQAVTSESSAGRTPLSR
ncbi:hypothetical protein ABT033_00610 [Streptomyces pharetrae]|uniref:DinB/UmuC family translesion DNA polymerase n=1 Tax=Streptomyces pharetrae TaxID=291370 RepID=UPI00335EE389